MEAEMGEKNEVTYWKEMFENAMQVLTDLQNEQLEIDRKNGEWLVNSRRKIAMLNSALNGKTYNQKCEG